MGCGVRARADVAVAAGMGVCEGVADGACIDVGGTAVGLGVAAGPGIAVGAAVGGAVGATITADGAGCEIGASAGPLSVQAPSGSANRSANTIRRSSHVFMPAL